MPQTIARTPTTESTAIIQKSIALTPSALSLVVECNEVVTRDGCPRNRVVVNSVDAGGSYAAHLRPCVGGGACRDRRGRRGITTERGARSGRALSGLGRRLRLRGLSARRGGGSEGRGGRDGHAVVGLGGTAGARDGRPGVPLRGEVLGGGAGARRLGRIDDGVRGVVALRGRRFSLPPSSQEAA